MSKNMIKILSVVAIAATGYFLFLAPTVEQAASNAVFSTLQTTTDKVGNVLGLDDQQKKIGLAGLIEALKRGAIL